MACQIVIPMSGSDRIEEVLPYLESVAQPKMKAVFLIHVGLSQFHEITAQLLASGSGVEPESVSAAGNGGELTRKHLPLAEKEILPRCEELRAAGMDIIVSVFTGSWRKAVLDYARNEEVHLVMMRGKAGWLSRMLRRMVSHIRRFKAATPPPVLLFRPNAIPGRLR